MASLYEEVRSALSGSAFRPKKRLGQNFLIHERVIESIVRLLKASASDEVIEIGPGLGFLTRRLVEIVAKVWAIEIDPFLIEWLRRASLGSHPGVQLVHGDILKIRLDDLLPRRKIKLANLPYSISTEALFRIFDAHEHFSLLVLTVQKEVAERIASQPGSKSYGTLSVWSQVHGRVVEKVQVSPEAFFPEPLVANAELPLFRGLVRAVFGQRRKTLANALVIWLKRDRDQIEEVLCAEKIDPKQRGESLSVPRLISLARALERRHLLSARI